jgi:transcriptional regulator with AAA-type ATPase domain
MKLLALAFAFLAGVYSSFTGAGIRDAGQQPHAQGACPADRATHRKLPAMVRQGTFREDLYYRLKVFPIQVPALRQRNQDIPSLVRHSTALYAQRMNKRIDVILPETMDVLTNYLRLQ